MAEPWTTDTIREAFIYDGGESAYYDPVNGEREHRRIAGDIFDAWLAAHDAQKRAEWEAGLVELARDVLARSKGRRWYVPAWTDSDANTHVLGTPTVAREYAEVEMHALRETERANGGRPDLVALASRVEYPWGPVNENGEATGREVGSPDPKETP